MQVVEHLGQMITTIAAGVIRRLKSIRQRKSVRVFRSLEGYLSSFPMFSDSGRVDIVIDSGPELQAFGCSLRSVLTGHRLDVFLVQSRFSLSSYVQPDTSYF